MKKKLVALFLAVMMLVTMLPVAAMADNGWNNNWGNNDWNDNDWNDNDWDDDDWDDDDWDDDDDRYPSWTRDPQQTSTPTPQPTAASNSINHIDINCTGLTATINGETEVFSFDGSDVANGLDKGGVDVYINNSVYSGETSTSTDGSGNSQIRFNGTFNVGTKDSPVNYNIELKKKINGVIVTLSVSTNYWASNNICPGKSNNVSRNSGIDVVLGFSSAESQDVTTKIDVHKFVNGLGTDVEKTYVFDVYKKVDGDWKLYFDNVKCDAALNTENNTTVEGYVMIPLGTNEFGEFKVVEDTDAAAVEGYEMAAPVYSEQEVTISKDVTEKIITVTNTYTKIATPEPTEEPTPEPTEEPTPEPTEEPTPEPTAEPTPEPTEEPTPEPTEEPTPEPTEEPTPEPTEEPTPEPTEEPTEEPTPEPTAEPTPTAVPTPKPTPKPTVRPTPVPTAEPTPEPTEEPTPEPTEEPTPEPTEEPTPEPTEEPTAEPTEEPVVEPTEEPKDDDDDDEVIPKTGNDRNSGMWWMLAAFSAVCAVALFAGSRKYSRNSR